MNLRPAFWKARRIVATALTVLLFLLTLWSCERTQDPSKTNPLDPGNPLTSGNPFNLRAELSAHHDTVTLRWDAVAVQGVVGYQVLRQVEAEDAAGAMADVADTVVSYLDLTTAGGTTYTYWIAARNAAGRVSDVAGLDGVAVEVVAYADLAVSKSVAPETVVEGGTITYTVTVANHGPRPATGVAVTDELPAAYVDYQSHSDGLSYDPSSGVWTVGALGMGESASLEIVAVVRHGARGQTITNEARVTALDQVDPAQSNDVAAVSVVAGGAGPAIIHVSPNVGPTTGGTQITITGVNLQNTNSVTFGGNAGTGLTLVSPTQVRVTTPAGAAGAVHVVLTTPGGQATLASGFAYITGPAITSVSPNVGPTAGGTEVTITGTTLIYTSSVTFGGNAGTSLQVDSNTQVRVTTPAGAAGAVDVVLTTPGGLATQTNGFTYSTTGTIVVATIPVEASWVVVGPSSFRVAGTGDHTFPDRELGEYTVFWSPFDNYRTPVSETQTLDAGGSQISFNGEYISNPSSTSGFVHIPPGTFMIGSHEGEPGYFSTERPQHQVTLTQGFYMSRYEVTEQWWYEVMGGNPTTSQLPKSQVSWDLAVQFCNALSNQEALTPAYTIHGPDGDVSWNQNANGYRLPTEAEWEYACRATTTMAYHNNTNCLSSDTEANYDGHHPLDGCPEGINRGTSTEVGNFPANQWGLYDMHGNLWEWVWCGWREYSSSAQQDPVTSPAIVGGPRVIRGGSWYHGARICRSARRVGDAPAFEGLSVGFRPVRSAS